jgi:hypothetical protein
VQFDEFGRVEAHRVLWCAPTTLEQLGELMAQWLNGTITLPACLLRLRTRWGNP